MKNFTLSILLSLLVFYSYGQTEQDSIITTKEVEKQVKVQTLEVPVYQLFPTENYWTFIKLDTRNGKMWQVHFTISEDGYQGEIELNSRSLVWDNKEIRGRFTLQPTTNIYNFILIDQLNGNTYQVQWNNDDDKRFVSRIY